MDNIRKIIREEIVRVMQEIGEDPIKNAQNMVNSNELQVKELENELRYRQSDARVQGLPREEKKAREERMNLVKDRLDIAKQELEMSKQAQINAVQMQQSQTQLTQTSGEQQSVQEQSQVQSQI